MLTLAEVAERLGLSTKTVLRLIKTGQLRAIKAGTAPNSPIRVSEEALAEFVKQSAVVPAGATS